MTHMDLSNDDGLFWRRHMKDCIMYSATTIYYKVDTLDVYPEGLPRVCPASLAAVRMAQPVQHVGDAAERGGGGKSGTMLGCCGQFYAVFWVHSCFKLVECEYTVSSALPRENSLQRGSIKPV